MTKYTKKWIKHRREIAYLHRIWFNMRFINILLIYCMIKCVAVKYKSPEWSDSNPPTLQHLYDLLYHSTLPTFLFVISIPCYFFCRALQHACQSEIDDFLLDKPTWHFAEIIPLKGIWVHRREAFLFYLRTRRFKLAIRNTVVFAQCLAERRARRFHRLNLPFSKKRKEAKEASTEKNAQ